MLERIAVRINRRGCSIRNVQKVQLSSKRMLHSTFWVHGGEALLDQVLGGHDEPEARRHKFMDKLKEAASVCSNQGRRFSTSGLEWPARDSPGPYSLSAFGLDFLYPPKALALLRRISLTVAKNTESQAFRYSPRSYSSLVADSARSRRETKAKEELESENDGYEYARSGVMEGLIDKREKRKGAIWTPTSKRSLEYLNPVDFDKSPQSYDRAWTWYYRSKGAPRRPAMLLEGDRARRKTLLNYIAFSQRHVDMEKVISLIEGLEPDERRKTDYRHLVNAYLSSGQVALALKALQTFSEGILDAGHVGFEALLAYAIEHDMWDRALETWRLLQVERDGEPIFRSIRPDFVVIRIPSFPQLFTTWASHLAPNDLDARDLSLWLFHGVQKNFATPEARFSEQNIEHLLQFLTSKGWYLPDFAAFEYEILGFSYKEKHDVVIQKYEEYRKHINAQPAAILLDRVLVATIERNDFRVMQMIFDDWFKYHGQPSAKAYRAIMKTFAWRGEHLICEDLFQQFSERFEATAKEFNNVLRAYVERGEVATAAEKLFNMDQYNLTPDIHCFDTVLEGFARAEDMESAMEYLSKLLEQNLTPTSRTYTAMMYVCAARGDFENVEVLFRAAGNSGVRTTSTMWNMLVWAHVNGGARSLAWKLINFIHQQNLKFPLTHMYNMLMSAHANKKEIRMVNKIYKQMQERDVPFDLYTYTIMMRSLAQHQSKADLRKARRMLDLLATEDIPTDTVPYTTLMQGYLRRRDYAEVFTIYKVMIERKVNPDFATQSMLLLASVFEAQQLAEYTGNVDLRNAEEISRLAIENFSGYDPSNMISIKTAVPDSLFTPLISAYIYKEDYDAVFRTYQKFLEVSGQNGINASAPSMNLLLKLMHASQREGNWDALRELWDIVYKEAQRQSRPLGPLSTGRHVVTVKKRLLCPAFDIMIRAAIDKIDFPEKEARGITVDEIAKLMNNLIGWGFDLDGGNWNILIVLVAKAGDLEQAFRIAETQLVREEAHTFKIAGQKRYGFVGWAKHAQHPHTATLDILAGQINGLYTKARGFEEGSDEARSLIRTLALEYPLIWKLCSIRRKRGQKAEREETHKKLTDFVEIAKRVEPMPKISHVYKMGRRKRAMALAVEKLVTGLPPGPDSEGYEDMDY